ncbi:HTH-type transcriptional repressor DasR [Rugosimonospora africana]|uniref:HTH-type transcriptional repressor DasR n=2 Tax=Rugosimonospora africana TaxID=556532 RepID=A0A8J3VSL0_9ACTN|nr:HTH-type transcriptional repressor DasR [Rugosimonospora africana]
MVAKHLQVREHVLALIDRMPPDTLLPQERELAEQCEVSRATVRQALQSLIEDGRIYSVRGRGTFVSQRRISKGLTLTSFSDDMRARDLEPGSRLLAAKQSPAGDDLARHLEIRAGDPVYHVERLRLADGFPMCVETIRLPATPFPRLLDHDLAGSLYQLLASRYRTTVATAEQHICARALDRRNADLLGVPPRSPALQVRRRGIDSRGRVVEYGESLYRADRYDFELTIHR